MASPKVLADTHGGNSSVWPLVVSLLFSFFFLSATNEYGSNTERGDKKKKESSQPSHCCIVEKDNNAEILSESVYGVYVDLEGNDIVYRPAPSPEYLNTLWNIGLH
jgi:hypothetical protein